MAGLTTQPMSKQPALLSKSAFVERARQRARRYDQDFSPSLLADLIKDALVPGSVVVDRAGRRPVYRYDFRSYRRALQIVRMRARGVVSRDAIELQLYLHRYSWRLPPREALIREYRQHIRSLLAPLRSRYLDNDRPVGAKHLQKLSAAMGSLDPDLAASGFGSTPEFWVRAARTAKNEPVVQKLSLSQFGRLVWLVFTRAPWSRVAEAGLPLLSGTFMLDGAVAEADGGTDYFENVVRRASDASIAEALIFYRFQFAALRRLETMLRRLRIRPTNSNSRLITKLLSLRHDARWCASLFLIAILVNEKINEVNWSRSHLMNSTFAAKLSAPFVRGFFLKCAQISGLQLNQLKGPT